MILKKIMKIKRIKEFKQKHFNKLFISKTINLQIYSKKKVCLTYERLNKPKIQYSLNYNIKNDCNTYYLNVSKTVYNSFNIVEDLKSLKNGLFNYLNLDCDNFKINDVEILDIFNKLNQNYYNNIEKLTFQLLLLLNKGLFIQCLELLNKGLFKIEVLKELVL